AEYVIGYSMACEFVPPQRRGRALGIMAFASMSSGFVASLLAALIIPELGWRPLYLIGGVGALYVWFLRRKLPESPRWLEKMGRLEEAEQVIGAIEREASPDAKLLPAPVSAAGLPERWVPVSVLLSRPVIRRTLLAMITNIAVMVGSYSFTSWVPSLFVEQGYSLGRSLSLTTIMTFGNIVGPATCIFISDRIGRRWAIIIAALCCSTTALFYAQQSALVGLVALGFGLTTLMSLMMGLGVGGYSPELFPTEYRLRGNGLAQMVGRTAVVLSPYVVVALFHGYGIVGVTGWIAGIYLTLALALLLFGIETNQRSLEALDPKVTGSGSVQTRPREV
ncbi:MAG TPA: MFS transporter, partial [Rhodopila sp.]